MYYFLLKTLILFSFVHRARRLNLLIDTKKKKKNRKTKKKETIRKPVEILSKTKTQKTHTRIHTKDNLVK